MTARLAIFDLDNTLLCGDSDHAFGEFLIARGLVDAQQHKEGNDRFYRDYLAGDLDIHAYLCFALAPLAGLNAAQLTPLQVDFMANYVEGMRLQKADALLQQHRDAGDFLLIITATNELVTTPIAAALGVDDLLASNAEIKDDRYTGKPCGTPCYHQGKVTRLNAWLEQRPFELSQAIFYSDSHNDIPLLTSVGEAVAVDADERLSAHASANGWRQLSLRN